MIDWARVDELRSEVGDDAFDEVVVLFLEEVDEHIDQLPALTELRQIKDALHFLKGSALNLGFERFAQLCSEGELASSRGVSVVIDPILESYVQSRDRFMSGLNKRLIA